MSNSVFTSPALEFRVDGGRLTNYGPGVLYYRDEAPVTATLNDGSLTAGDSVTLDGSQWVVSADRSAVDVIPRPPSAQSGSGGGSLLYGQAEASLTASLPWRAPAATRFVSATLTVADAVDGDVDVVEVLVDGEVAATLSVDDGETSSTAAIDVDVALGGLVTVSRIAADGGACQVQIDRGA